MYQYEVINYIKEDIAELIKLVRAKQKSALDRPSSPENLANLALTVTSWAQRLDKYTDIPDEIVLSNFDALFARLEFEIEQIAASQSITWVAPTRKTSLKEQIDCFNSAIKDLFPKINDKTKTTSDEPVKESRVKRIIKFDDKGNGFVAAVEKKKPPKRKNEVTTAPSTANEKAEATNEIDQNLAHLATNMEAELKQKFSKLTTLEEALELHSSLKEFDNDILTSPKILADLTIRQEIKRFNELIKDADKILNEWKKFNSNQTSNSLNNERLEVLADFNKKINLLHNEIKLAKVEIISRAENLLNSPRSLEQIKAEHDNAIENFKANLKIFFEKIEKLDSDNKVVKNIAENFIRDFTEKLSKEPSFNKEQVKALRHSLLSKIGIVENESMLSNMSSLLSFGQRTSFNLSNLVLNFPTDDTEALSRHVKSLYDLTEYLEDFELSKSKDSDLVDQNPRIEREINGLMDRLNFGLHRLEVISELFAPQANNSNYVAIMRQVSERREQLIQIKSELEEVYQTYKSELELARKENSVTSVSSLKEIVQLQKEVLEKLSALKVRRNNLTKTASFENIKKAYLEAKNELVEGYKLAIDDLLSKTLEAVEEELYDTSLFVDLIMHEVDEKVKEFLASDKLVNLPALEAQLGEDLLKRRAKVNNKRYELQEQSIQKQYQEVNQYASQLKELAAQVRQFPESLQDETVKEARLLVKELSKINSLIQDGYRFYQKYKQQQISTEDKVLEQKKVLDRFKPALKKLSETDNISNKLSDLTEKLKELHSQAAKQQQEKIVALEDTLMSNSPDMHTPKDSTSRQNAPLTSLTAEAFLLQSAISKQQFEENNKAIADKYREISQALDKSKQDLEVNLGRFPDYSKEPSVRAARSHVNLLSLARRDLDAIFKSRPTWSINSSTLKHDEIVNQQQEILSKQDEILTEFKAINERQDSKYSLELTALYDKEKEEKETLVAQFNNEVSQAESLLELYEGEKKENFQSTLDGLQVAVKELQSKRMHINSFTKGMASTLEDVKFLFKQIKWAIEDSKKAELEQIQQSILKVQAAQEEAYADLDRLQDNKYLKDSLDEINTSTSELGRAISTFKQKSSVEDLSEALSDINLKITAVNTALENEQKVRDKFLSKEHKACVKILKVIEQEYSRILNKRYLKSSGEEAATIGPMMTLFVDANKDKKSSEHLRDNQYEAQRSAIDPRLSKLAKIYSEFSAINDSYFENHSENATQTYREALNNTIQSLQRNELHDISENKRPWYAKLIRAITSVFKSNVEAPAPANNGAHVSSNRYAFSTTLGACKTEERLVDQFNDANKMLNDEELPPAPAF
ncbi:Uncharacterised protein [Legionella beliardensis]|uniref:Uncharacterized protein n=1 Tax=Legionella beliardensis TaxID=91822 RepID=A0A378I451_9GAMM|nr:hypothetical protein [Legionella beliardensis]STX29959.1 Uncharacterised protein [Legionella beliardensis]